MEVDWERLADKLKQVPVNQWRYVGVPSEAPHLGGVFEYGLPSGEHVCLRDGSGTLLVDLFAGQPRSAMSAPVEIRTGFCYIMRDSLAGKGSAGPFAEFCDGIFRDPRFAQTGTTFLELYRSLSSALDLGQVPRFCKVERHNALSVAEQNLESWLSSP